MLILLWLVAVLVGALALAYVNASGIVWSAAIAARARRRLGRARSFPTWLALALAVVFVLVAIPLNLPPLRRRLISDAVLAAFRKVLPPMSQTEREAIEAGTVWWDGELFSGRPDWKKLLDTPRADAHARRAALPRPRGRGALRDGHRLGDDQRPPRSPARRLAIHQGQGLLGNDASRRSTAGSASPRTRIRR